MATPMDAATSRLGSLVDDSAMTAKTTCPGLSIDSPSSRSTSSQWGGKIELTRTRLKFARCASRSAISKLVSFSLCRPTPFERKALVGTNIRESINPSPRARQWVRLLTAPAQPVDLQAVVMGPELHLLCEQRDHPLEPVVRELHHLPARRADAVLMRLAGRERLVPLEALAEIVLLGEAGADQEIERPVDRRGPDRDASPHHRSAHLVGRQVLGCEEHGLRHGQALVRRRQVVVGEIAAELLQQLGAVKLHTTRRPPPPPGPQGRRRDPPPRASPARWPPRTTAPSLRPPPSTARAPCRARPACSAPYRRAAGRPPRPGGRSPPCPTRGRRASAAGTGRWSRSRPAAAAPPPPRRPSPSPAPGPALAEEGGGGPSLLPSLRVEPQDVHEVLRVRHHAVRLVRAAVPQLVHDEFRLVDADGRKRPQVVR